MPFLALLANPIVRKVALFGLIIVAAGSAFLAFMFHERHLGAQQAAQAQAKIDAGYIVSVTKKLDDVDAYYRPYVDALNKAEQDRQTQLQKIAQLSAANDGKPGLSAAAVGRLRGLTNQSGSQTNTQQNSTARRVKH